MTIAYLKRPNFEPGGREVKKKHIENAVFLLPVSVGNEHHSGGKGEAILAMLAEKSQGPAYIILADTLQRFNLATKHGISLDEAEKKALEQGDEWEEWFEAQKEKRPALKKVEVIRWNAWRKKDKYCAEEAQVQEIYSKGNGYKTATDRAALAYVQGVIAKPDYENADMHDLLHGSVDYLKEETAITKVWIEFFIKKYPDMKICQLYPQDPNPVLQYLYEHLLTTEQRSQFEYLRICFQNPIENDRPKEGAKTPSTAQGDVLKRLEKVEAQLAIQNQMLATLVACGGAIPENGHHQQGTPVLFSPTPANIVIPGATCGERSLSPKFDH